MAADCSASNATVAEKPAEPQTPGREEADAANPAEGDARFPRDHSVRRTTPAEAYTALDETPAAPPSLAALIAAWEYGDALRRDTNRALEIEALGREPTTAEEESAESIAKAEFSRWEDILAYEPADIADLDRWTAWITEKADKCHLEEPVLATVRDQLKRIAAEAQTTPPRPPSATEVGSAALAEAIAAADAFEPTYQRLSAAHTAAEEAHTHLAIRLGLRIGQGDAPPEYMAAAQAEKAADEAHQRALDHRQNLARTVLSAPATRPADIIRKIDRYAQAFDAKSAEHLDFEGDVRAAFVEALDALDEMASAETSGPDADILAAWAELVAVREACIAEAAKCSAAFDKAYEVMEAELPTPEALKTSDPDCYLIEADIVADPNLTFDQKSDLVPISRAYRKARDEAYDRYQIETLSDASDEAYSALNEATLALLNARAPDTHALLLKARLLLEETNRETQGDGPDNPETIARLLSVEDQQWRGGPLVRIYFDLLRLTGTASPVLDVAPFDAKGWADAFEALPGHQIGGRGPIYYQPEAWGSTLTEADFRVTDPTAIAAYKAWVKAKLGGALWAEELRKSPSYETLPFQIAQVEAIEIAFDHDHAERNRLLALWEEWIAICTQPPIGRRLWAGLTDWQQTLVKAEGRARELARRDARTAELSGGTVNLTDAGERGPDQGDPALTEQLIDAGAIQPRAEVGMAAE